jgi:antitoxin ParD1/3/4
MDLEESRMMALNDAIQEGVNRSIAPDFDPEKHLQSLKAN